ncbi:MAG: HEAT repeat domain-containing protein [Elusimicrobia bacterium]|nr:HEAT repeat domain-containing protein [Elusimicrobiota bacterium]
MRLLLAALLALLPSLPAQAARRSRARPQTIRPGLPTDGAPACRDLKPYANRMRWGFAVSQDNQLNCGAGVGEPSNYILPTPADQPYEMHVVSVAGGSFPVATGDPSSPDASVQVVVYKTKKPSVLVLSAKDPLLWDVTVTPEASLELIIVQGRGKQVVRGVPEEIPILHRTWDQACAYAHAWEPRRNLAGPDLPLLISSLRCSTGLRESSMQGCQEGALFEIPHYRQDQEADPAVRWERPCPLAIDPDIPLPRRRQSSSSERLDPMESSRARPAPGSEPAVVPERLPPARGVADPAERLLGEHEELKPPAGPDPSEEKPLDAPPTLAEPPRRTAPEQAPKGALSGSKEALPRPESPAGREDIPVRALAILLRGDLTLLTHDAVPDLLVALEKGDETLRWRAADALGQLGAAGAAAVPALAKALKEKSWRVRSSSALALGNIGVQDKAVLKRLRKLLKDPHPDVSHSAKTALERLGDK